VSGEAYVLLMLKALSARGSLFLFVRTHHHLEYYFNLSDLRFAANEFAANNISIGRGMGHGGGNVVEIRAARRAGLEQPRGA
jgi:hypothetical protein